MAAQTKYGYATPSGVPGGLFDLAPYEVNTRTNEEEAGKLKFGHGAVVGASLAMASSFRHLHPISLRVS